MTLTCIFVAVALIAFIVRIFARNQNWNGKIKKIFTAVGILSLLIAIGVFINSCVVYIPGGRMSRVYPITGGHKNLDQGYHLVSPLSKTAQYDMTLKSAILSEGDAPSDIYGAQTNEGVYLVVVSTVSYKIDPEKFDQYVEIYGTTPITDTKILEQIKSHSRAALEAEINQLDTNTAIKTKNSLSLRAEAKLMADYADSPIIIDSFIIDDLVAPNEWEEAINKQTQLRMDTENAILAQKLVDAETAKALKEANAELEKAKVDASKEAEEAKIKKIAAAEADAETKKIAADTEAYEKEKKATAAAMELRISTEAEAEAKRIAAEAEANAIITKGNAEAEALAASGAAYTKYPELMELTLTREKLNAEKVWAEKWSGISFEGMSDFSFANVSELMGNLLNRVFNPGTAE